MFRTAAVAGLTLGLLAGPLHAGSDKASDKAAEAALGAKAENKVSVSIDTATLPEDVVTELTSELDLQADGDLPETVDVPVGIAAEVCQMDANELAQAEDATCEARTTTMAFNQAIDRQMNGGAGAQIGTGAEAETDIGTDMEPETQMETDTEMETTTE